MESESRSFRPDGVLALGDPVLTRVAWSPHGDFLAVPDHSGTLRVITFPEMIVSHELHAARLQVMSGGSPHKVLWPNKAFWTASWSADGARLAVGGRDNTVHVFDPRQQHETLTLVSHIDDVHAVCWGDDDTKLLSASYDGTLKLWDASTGELIRSWHAHEGRIEDAYWVPDSAHVLSGGRDGHVRIWDIDKSQLIGDIPAHRGFVLRVVTARHNGTLITASSDGTVRVWEEAERRALRVVTGFTGTPHDLSLSHDERLLAVKDDHRSIKIFRTDTFELVEVVTEIADHHHWYGSARFHPSANVLAVTGDGDRQLRIWSYDGRLVDQVSAESVATAYANCRVGVLGNTGVGKTALSNALRGEPFEPTESTHATKTSLLDRRVVESDGIPTVREVFLWDFAGQPVYRLLQRLDVEDIALALLVLDNRNTAEPQSEIREWEILLRAAATMTRPRRVIVVARVDRGGLSAPLSDLRWEEEVDGFAGIIETSAKEGVNIAALQELILDTIDWSTIPVLTSDMQFQRLRIFVMESLSQGRVIEPIHALYKEFCRYSGRHGMREPSISEFRALLGCLDTEGLVKRLGFGNLILLDPSLLRSYASMILIAAQRVPSGDGTLREDDILEQRIPLLAEERIEDNRREPDLLHAAIQEYLNAGVVLREGEDPHLCFPAANRLPVDEERWRDLERGCAFTLTGLADHIHSSLVVALQTSGLFTSRELWTATARFMWQNGHASWVRVRHDGAGQVWAEVRHESVITPVERRLFEELCRAYLTRSSADKLLVVRSSMSCHNCNTAIPEEQVRRRLARGYSWLRCNVCEERLNITEPADDLATSRADSIASSELQKRATQVMSAEADLKKKRDLFDVFISYSHEDEAPALALAKRLTERGIRPWIDIWNAYPGKPWLEAVQEQIDSISCAAVLIGPSGIGPWQRDEVWYFLQQFFSRRCPVIPVLLEGAGKPQIPTLLENMQWVDFRRSSPDPIDLLVWGITGDQH